VANEIDRELSPFWVGLVRFKEPIYPRSDTIVIFPSEGFSLVCDKIKIMPYQNVRKVNSTDKDKIIKELL